MEGGLRSTGATTTRRKPKRRIFDCVAESKRKKWQDFFLLCRLIYYCNITEELSSKQGGNRGASLDELLLVLFPDSPVFVEGNLGVQVVDVVEVLVQQREGQVKSIADLEQSSNLAGRVIRVIFKFGSVGVVGSVVKAIQ